MDEIKNKIENLIYSFFNEMNKWEKFCYEVDNNDALSYEDKILLQKNEAKRIVDKFLTKKERKMGLPNCISYGYEGSYKYNPEEERIVFIEVEKSKSVVTTSREEPLGESNKYVLKRTKKGWLIDSKKCFSNVDDKWKNCIL